MDSRTLERKMKFIDDYKLAKNASTGSKYDSNANVTQKNLATLQCELGKKDIIDLRRGIICSYLEKESPELAQQFLKRLEFMPQPLPCMTHTQLIYTMAMTYIFDRIIKGYITTIDEAIDTFVKLSEPHIVEVNLADILGDENDNE